MQDVKRVNEKRQKTPVIILCTTKNMVKAVMSHSCITYSNNEQVQIFFCTRNV